MYKKMIKKFLKENDVKNNNIPSVSAMAHFQIKILLKPEANNELEIMMKEITLKDQMEREKMVEKEKNEIQVMNCEELIRTMRKNPDVINQSVIAYRALAFEDEIIPQIIRMFKTSLNTGFIEIATRILSICNKDIADELVGYFDDVRSPYAQSMILLIMGFKGEEKHVPWLIDKYKAMKRSYPNESYSDSVIYALDEIEGRFYLAK